MNKRIDSLEAHLKVSVVDREVKVAAGKYFSFY